MSYDDDEPCVAGGKTVRFPTLGPRDLESIVQCMELAALVLTPKHGATFTREELFMETRDFYCQENGFLEADLDIVLGMGWKTVRDVVEGRLAALKVKQ